MVPSPGTGRFTVMSDTLEIGLSSLFNNKLEDREDVSLLHRVFQLLWNRLLYLPCAESHATEDTTAKSDYIKLTSSLNRSVK